MALFRVLCPSINMPDQVKSPGNIIFISLSSLYILINGAKARKIRGVWGVARCARR